MLAGLAPLHTERLLSRGGPALVEDDPLVFYDTSSYGPRAVSLLEEVVGAEQLLYGSDRPVMNPNDHRGRDGLNWQLLASNAERAFSGGPTRAFSGDPGGAISGDPAPAVIAAPGRVASHNPERVRPRHDSEKVCAPRRR
jgi:hypothetical protein